MRSVGVWWCGGVARLPLREAQRVEGLGTARLRGVGCGAGCDTQCGVRTRGRTGRAAARGRTDGSRFVHRDASARRGRVRLCDVWCAARCGAQCGACALGRRPRPLVASVWHAGCVGLRSGASSTRTLLLGRWRDPQHTRTPPCEEERARAPRARSAGKGRGLYSSARETLRGRPPSSVPSLWVRASAACGSPWRAQPAGARKQRRIHSIAHLAGFACLGEDQSPGRTIC